MRTITATAIAATLLASAAAHAGPVACEPTEHAWWARNIARGKVDLSRSLPEMHIAYVRWDSGEEQVVTVAYVDGMGVCATDRVTVR